MSQLTQIGTDGIKDDAITQPKIGAGAVGTTEIANNAVVTGKVQDGTLTSSDLNASVSLGEGFYQGENGSTSSVSKKGDIFRVNESTLNTSVTIAAGDNASCAGPLTVSTSGTVNLTVNGNLTII